MSRASNIIGIAQRLIGIKEKPGNTGFSNAIFERDMKLIGWYMGAPWCAFVVLFIMLEAYYLDAKLKATIKKCFTGGALDTWNRVKKDGTFKTGTEPKNGAVIIWQHGNTTRGHAGIVEKINLKDNSMQCLEGNTNSHGSREGDHFARKTRTINRPFIADGLNIVGYIYPLES